MVEILHKQFPVNEKFYSVYGLEFSSSTEWIRLRSYTVLREALNVLSLMKSNLNLYSVRVMKNCKEDSVPRAREQRATHHRLPLHSQPLAVAAWVANKLGLRDDREFIAKANAAIATWQIMRDDERMDFLIDSEIEVLRKLVPASYGE